MVKKLIFALCIFGGLALALVLIIGTKKASFDAMAEAGKLMVPPPESVATFTAERQSWIDSVQAIGSIEPVQGVRLDAEVAGVVNAINFKNGQNVEVGDILVQLDVSVEAALLNSNKATADLAKTKLDRAKRLRGTDSIAQSQLDQAQADFDTAIAQMNNLEAIIDRKTIRAPFTGRVGIRQINLGQYLSQGAPIVSLQSCDQVFVNFTLPQQAIARIKTGMQITLQSDVYPDQQFEGTLTAISPQIDPTTRTVKLQGTLDNPDELLRPGLFVKATVTLPNKNEVLVVPATSIVFAPYGNSIFKVVTETDEETGVTTTIVKQSFIRTGKHMGDFVSIIEGIEEGDEVVSAGAFKLRNGMPVTIHNEMAPKPELAPNPKNS
ncbi:MULTISPECIES: efflux RND transporter periplasmic adaptor subunit [unclassified Lentimonas]|uniref:efflux RND transporter periplasmic adaptor subunit n=1 Tax=unclassified Lentimonas TaxID=2630993 RepID=UPI001324A9BB|nr:MULTISPECIES: efflux RND transporter periplasmic adaptor subunit [unclassified Lentimonas]CAA6679076.1 Probable Co/Zn/Cd efflux system membrane fusion protein [Lentimonas sp. CC4]CAA6684184.1 Probable Co/Zn/Cd efflux system membrane fusion protein [Lentimonas sp. CC6]CAA6693718.1 Probable Co/Zn/Cd efflux system membrane fusion protein [Lentimonas sp. CC10]CAA6696360.1 Probable Co/Zn/Cd efflux system membrane fusion protein [Lentimonas sp. CC19]CAA7071653.1 Probable Co/Zn/Cd efflux system me